MATELSIALRTAKALEAMQAEIAGLRQDVAALRADLALSKSAKQNTAPDPAPAPEPARARR